MVNSFGLGFINSTGQISYVIDKSQSVVRSHPSSLVFTDSTIWVGTGKSLAIYNRENKSFVNAGGVGKGGPQGGIISMCKDQYGNIWMGGREGLFMYSAETNRFQKVDIDFSGFITALTAPNKELLLIGTTREVLIFKYKEFIDREEIIAKTFNFRNGLTAQEIAQNGFIKWQDKLLFPSTTNTTLLDLEQVNFDSEFFNVAVTQFNSEAVDYLTRNGKKTLMLTGGQNDFEFGFETIGFGLPTKPVYRFRLLGLNDKWSDWTEQDYANFNNLPSGDYTFEVAVKPAIISQLAKEKNGQDKCEHYHAIL